MRQHSRRNYSLAVTGSDRVFQFFNLLLILAIFVVLVWPLWFVLIASFSDPNAVNSGQVLLIPKGLTLSGYKRMLEYKDIWTGFSNTIFYTLTGTTLNMVLSVCMAYPMSVKEFAPRKILMVFFMITMYFSGGLIPTYLLMKNLDILNTRWAMILPGAVSVYNCLIIRSYFMNSIPAELKEASILDGANPAQYLFQVVLPLSAPVLAVITLYYMVGHWNSYLNALYYIYDFDLYPLQSVLRELLMSDKMMAAMVTDPELARQAMQTAQAMKYCVVIVSIVPMLCVYPFVQKHFVKGVMIGAVKG